MAIKHAQIEITTSATQANVIEIHVPATTFKELVKKATKKKKIQPEFVIQILARHLISKRGAKVNAAGTVDNW